MEKILTPELFWKAYSAKLNLKGDLTAYQSNSEWTKKILGTAKDIGIAEDTYKEIVKEKEKEKKEEEEKIKWGTNREYYRVDLIGWRKEEKPKKEKPEEESKKKKLEEGYNWWLDLAFEHENDNTWDGELCKLCYVGADLRVVSSYYRLQDGKGQPEAPIDQKLQDFLNKLGEEKVFRIPESKWLFVFGPRLACANQPFKVFKVDQTLKVVPIGGGEEVVPERWKGN